MLKGVVVDQSALFTTTLQAWEDFYNFDRPHGALGGQTPYERLRQKIETSDVSGQRQSHICSPDGIRTHNLFLERKWRQRSDLSGVDR